MPTAAPFNVDAFLDKQKFGPVHIKTMVVLILLMMVDGYDITIVGWTLPAIAKSLEVKPHAMTGVFVAQQFGLLLGTFMLGPLSDRFGRRTILLSCVGLFTALTLLTSFVTTVQEFVAVRFVSALFFSAIIPNCIAMASEIAPSRIRTTIVAVVFCGYSGGNFFEAIVQAFMLERFGWQSAFLVGAGLGVVVFALLAMMLPESIRFRTQRNAADPKIGKALRNFDPSLSFDSSQQFVLNQEKLRSDEQAKKQRSPVSSLFSKGFLVPTLLLWTAYISVFTVSHLKGAWLTTLLHNVGGLSFQTLALISTIGTLAGICGTISSGYFIDRFGAARCMPVLYVCGAICLASYGLIDLHSPAVFMVGALLAYFSNSGLGGVNIIGSVIYPSRMRATGISWGAGAGRIGGMLGPIAGGFMLAQNWDLRTIFICTGLPLFVAALSLAFIGRWAPNQRDRAQAELADAEAADLVPSKVAGA